MIDYHMHTDYTRDAEGKVDDFCKAAVEKGIEEIAFTNHFIIIRVGKPKRTITPEQIFEHVKDIQSAREKFDLKIRLGLECDYWQAHHREIEKVLNEHDFDFVLGSTHYIEGHSISDSLERASKFFEGKSEYEAYGAYFKRVIEIIESGLVDVIAHPDYIRKNTIRFYGKSLPFEQYQDLVEKVIDALIDNKVGIEVNTGGHVRGINDCFPSLDFLKLCKEAGVKIITLGSDAHSPYRVGFNLERGIERLKEAGYKKVSLFDKRKSKSIALKKL